MSSQYVIGCSFRTGVEISLESLLFVYAGISSFHKWYRPYAFFVLQYFLHLWMYFVYWCTPKIKIAVTSDQQCLLLF